ncbi:MAG TPA: PIG-L family deacetylase [Caldithrix abyssi]|uniref:PIG-L family deacetylase n=1 Tax=Caldithrix abyssi TaxID=187145 RepID=A0A7V4U1R4_CALAY|nr:PIG-L family deacetylase [Caldithrix abyssi]
MTHFQKILILGPHTDDGEFGCGGTIARFVEEKREVYYATFSLAEESVPEGLPKDILFTEVQNSSKVLGIKDDHLLIYRYPVRKFAQYRQEILEDLVQLKKDLDPDLVLMPSPHDLHQDHYTIAVEGLRAFKFTSILGYEMPWNNINFETRSFIHLQERHIDIKLKSVQCYRSQTGRKYANADFIKGWAKTRGVQCGVDFAETFEVIRWIIR